jgi:transposase
MQVADHLTIERLSALADSEPGRRRSLRIRAVIPAAEGRTAPEIAAALGRSRRAVQGRVARYNDEGPAGFDDRPRPGRPPFLDAEAAERLRARLDAGPTAEDAACTLRGPEVRAILGRESGVLYSMPAVYTLLHRLGYSCLDPRPRHREADPEAAEASKKKPPT